MLANGKTPAKPFSKQTFWKEINVAIRKASKHKSLDLFEAAMKRKRACQQKISNKESSASKLTTSNGSVHVLEPKFTKNS